MSHLVHFNISFFFKQMHAELDEMEPMAAPSLGAVLLPDAHLLLSAHKDLQSQLQELLGAGVSDAAQLHHVLELQRRLFDLQVFFC